MSTVKADTNTEIQNMFPFKQLTDQSEEHDFFLRFCPINNRACTFPVPYGTVPYPLCNLKDC